MSFSFRELLRKRQPDNLPDQELVGLLEPGVEFEGRMNITSGMVRLNTHLKGEIHCEGILILADLSEVEGEIHSKLVSVAGKVKGAIHAAERVEIKAHGVVLGDVYTASLIVEPGGYFDGQCHMPTPVPAPANRVAEPEGKS